MNRALKAGVAIAAVGTLTIPLTGCDPFYGGHTDLWQIACFVRNGTYTTIYGSTAGNRDCTGMTGGPATCADVLAADPRIGRTHADQVCWNVGYGHWAGSMGHI